MCQGAISGLIDLKESSTSRTVYGHDEFYGASSRSIYNLWRESPVQKSGGTFGGTLYDGRDLKMARFSTQDISGILPNTGMLWPGGAIGYTGGTFIQHNKKLSARYINHSLLLKKDSIRSREG